MKKMRPALPVCALFLTFFCFISPSSGLFAAEKEETIKINWVKGPGKVDIGDIAGVDLPGNYAFADSKDTIKIMEALGNRPSGRELGFIEPASGKWFIVFEFDEIGYVKDDEKGKLDADAILDSIREGNKRGNEWRKKKNLPLLKVIGWQQKPSYDPVTNNLEWATLAESEGRKIINYNIRYLGRNGVMEIVLVGNPENFAASVKEAKGILEKYSFKQGNKYTEFVKGDKIAEYGLTALVTGGAVAVAAKSGLLSKLWKFIAVGFLAVAGVVKKFFGRLFGGRKENDEIIMKSDQ